MVVHKTGRQTVTRYEGFGQYNEVPSPLCVGAKGVYSGKSFYVHRLWKYVTCKHCLKRRKETKMKIEKPKMIKAVQELVDDISNGSFRTAVCVGVVAGVHLELVARSVGEAEEAVAAPFKEGSKFHCIAE